MHLCDKASATKNQRTQEPVPWLLHTLYSQILLHAYGQATTEHINHSDLVKIRHIWWSNLPSQVQKVDTNGSQWPTRSAHFFAPFKRYLSIRCTHVWPEDHHKPVYSSSGLCMMSPTDLENSSTWTWQKPSPNFSKMTIFSHFRSYLLLQWKIIFSTNFKPGGGQCYAIKQICVYYISITIWSRERDDYF